jgi:hypothetical protein
MRPRFLAYMEPRGASAVAQRDCLQACTDCGVQLMVPPPARHIQRVGLERVDRNARHKRSKGEGHEPHVGADVEEDLALCQVLPQHVDHVPRVPMYEKSLGLDSVAQVEFENRPPTIRA